MQRVSAVPTCAPPPPPAQPPVEKSVQSSVHVRVSDAQNREQAGQWGWWTVGRDALERKGPRRRPQERLRGRLEKVVKAVGGSHCRLRMPLKLALGVTGTVAGHRLGALEGEGFLPPVGPMGGGGRQPLG